ncbi:hypothetical protein AM493_10040 [Flavobacterium akiainvivens]|uniref:Uncharacterized protein n=1 Tax=Flavobacterium akiainvivens TaxID=1202724 RepID=A0A0M8MD61_9FLAO|nr:hypothetical protein [Flavobacterium akiainvivens]KOS06334.1 hypothetical protein AM493_10040 [Flavobacterium akiainvivens]SFQ15970.1 hypothetical protein SAMN05444144_101355 [Flavobacterium akiainvivens]
MTGTNIFKRNLIAVCIGVFFLGLYLFFTYSGNRLCGCAPSEKYKPGHTRAGYYGGANRYYHK